MTDKYSDGNLKKFWNTKKNQQIHLLMLVGRQPSGPANLLNTLKSHSYMADHVYLFFTRNTQTESDKIAKYCQNNRCAGRVSEYLISDSLFSPSEQPSVTEIYQQLKILETDKQVLYADPGISSMAVALCQAMPLEQTLFLYQDVNALHAVQRKGNDEIWDSLPLSDLGINPLLKLYGLDTEKNVRLPIPGLIYSTFKKTEKKVTFGMKIKGVEPVIDVAYEKHGRLYTLCVVPESLKIPQKRLLYIRSICGLLNKPELNGLIPIVAGYSHLRNERKHFQFFQCLDVKTKQMMEKWFSEFPSTPGTDRWFPANTNEPLESSIQQKPEDSFLTDKLVVSLGTNPASTLTALMTHRPKQAWIIVDTHTPAVISYAVRLKQIHAYLPVGELYFVNSDLMGRGILDWSQVNQNLLKDARLEITPGSKAQSRALASITNGELWSMDMRAKKSFCFNSTLTPVDMVMPSVEMSVRLAGAEGMDRVKAKEDFLSKLTEMYCYIIQTEAPQDWRYNDLPEERKAGVWCLTRNKTVLTLLQPGQTALTKKKQKPWHQQEGGMLFEALVANLFYQSGADEVWTNLTWPWDEKAIEAIQERQNQLQVATGKPLRAFIPHMTEIDIACVFNRHLVAISCKCGKYSLRNDLLEIEALTSHVLGRQAIPILVIPKVTPAQRLAHSLEKEKGAILLGLTDLVSINKLKETLNLIFQSRRRFT